MERLRALLGAAGDNRLPALAAETPAILAEQLREIAARGREVEIKLLAWHRANPASCRLASIPLRPRQEKQYRGQTRSGSSKRHEMQSIQLSNKPCMFNPFQTSSILDPERFD